MSYILLLCCGCFQRSRSELVFGALLAGFREAMPRTLWWCLHGRRDSCATTIHLVLTSDSFFSFFFVVLFYVVFFLLRGAYLVFGDDPSKNLLSRRVRTPFWLRVPVNCFTALNPDSGLSVGVGGEGWTDGRVWTWSFVAGDKHALASKVSLKKKPAPRNGSANFLDGLAL